MNDLRPYIRDVADFPAAGVLFRDITPLLADGAACRGVVDEMARRAPRAFSAVAAVEARGFLFGFAVAVKLGKPFVPVRKPGKLPCKTFAANYRLEYGDGALHIHEDALSPGDGVYLIDDLIASGGTLFAAAKIIRQSGATIKQIACLVELESLGGRQKLADFPFYSLLQYP